MLLAISSEKYAAHMSLTLQLYRLQLFQKYPDCRLGLSAIKCHQLKL